MLEIIQSRDSGKAKKLLEAAKKNNAIILTQNKSAFEVKAKSLGFKDVEIIDYQDLQSDNYSLGLPIYIHNADKVLEWFFNYYYNIKVCGFTATLNNNKREKK